MSSDLETYQRVIDHFTDLVNSVRDDQWSAPTPCEGWTVRDLLVHVVERDHRIASTVGGEEAPPLSSEIEPAELVSEWHGCVAWWANGLADPELRDTSWPTQMGELTFGQAAARFMTGELTVHSWDLARAIGADESLDPEAVAKAHASMRQAADMLRQPGRLGPEAPVAADADEQTKFLAFTGRTV